MSGSTTQRMATSEQPHATPSGNMGQKIAYAFGNLGQAAFYNTMSTFFITFVTTALFIDVDKTLAKRLIAVITGLIVVIRIAEIFLDRCSATSWTTRTPDGAGSVPGSSSAASCPASC